MTFNIVTIISWACFTRFHLPQRNFVIAVYNWECGDFWEALVIINWKCVWKKVIYFLSLLAPCSILENPWHASFFVSCQNNLFAISSQKYVSVLYIQLHTHRNRKYVFLWLFLLKWSRLPCIIKLDNEPKPLPPPYRAIFHYLKMSHSRVLLFISEKVTWFLIRPLYTPAHSPEYNNRIENILFKMQTML